MVIHQDSRTVPYVDNRPCYDRVMQPEPPSAVPSWKLILRQEADKVVKTHTPACRIAARDKCAYPSR
jgi:hypothetical protein